MRRLRDLFRRTVEAEHIMEDELFGKLIWVEKYGGWRGEMTLADGKNAAFTVDGIETEKSITEDARNTFTFLLANEPVIHDKIALSMSRFYNET